MIDCIHSYLVHPSKHAEHKPEISGTLVARGNRLFDMLAETYERAAQECNIDIQFRPDEDRRQNNSCRDLFLKYMRQQEVECGRQIAHRLQDVTTHKSGLGLLFLMKGTQGGTHTIVISRFPADQGVVAQEHAAQLSVEFIERVFMKNAKAYKSATYSSDSFERGFWQGRAVDRQVAGPREISDYWIRDFLDSELLTTGPAGTKRLAVALREAVRATDDLETKQQLVSAANLLRAQDGSVRTAREFLERMGLGEATIEAVAVQFPRDELLDETFRFERQEFDRHALYRAIQLDTGAMLVAEDASFEGVFQMEPAADNQVRYSTEGHIVNETLRKSR